jgi:hypothetical protein
MESHAAGAVSRGVRRLAGEPTEINRCRSTTLSTGSDASNSPCSRITVRLRREVIYVPFLLRVCTGRTAQTILAQDERQEGTTSWRSPLGFGHTSSRPHLASTQRTYPDLDREGPEPFARLRNLPFWGSAFLFKPIPCSEVRHGPILSPLVEAWLNMMKVVASNIKVPRL